MKVYIAGPMTGIPKFNYPAFEAAAKRLRADGYEVVSPIEMDDPAAREAAMNSPHGTMEEFRQSGSTATWGDFLSRDVKLLADDGIEAVVVLPGWQKSRGARLETFVASAMCGLPIYYIDPKWPMALHRVSLLSLFRAWCNEPTLIISGEYAFGKVTHP